jgi:hypothetical protein
MGRKEATQHGRALAGYFARSGRRRDSHVRVIASRLPLHYEFKAHDVTSSGNRQSMNFWSVTRMATRQGILGAGKPC